MANMIRRVTKLELNALAAIAYKKDIFAKMNKIWCRVNHIYIYIYIYIYKICGAF